MPSVSQKQANLMSAIKHGWHPPAGMHAPSLKVATEFHEADKRAGKFEHPSYADGGQVENDAPATNRWLSLISHAADRATATVTDDPHHAAARLAGGAISQWVGQSPQGNPQFGAKPNIINEIKSLPAGVTDIGVAGSNVLGALADKYLPKDNSTGGFASSTLARLRDQVNRYVGEHGDPAPKWSRDAEEASNQVHAGVNQAMGLSAPHGWTENLADAGGNMLGQLPLPAGEAKTATRGIKGGLRAAAGAIPEYLGPTIRPSVKNYLTGTAAGGVMGKLGDTPEAPPAPPATAQQPMSDDVIRAYLRAANIRAAMDPTQDHSALHNLTDYMDRRAELGAGAGPPPSYGEGGKVTQVSKLAQIFKELQDSHADSKPFYPSYLEDIATQHNFDPARASMVKDQFMFGLDPPFRKHLKKYLNSGYEGHFEDYLDSVNTGTSGSILDYEDFMPDVERIKQIHDALNEQLSNPGLLKGPVE